MRCRIKSKSLKEQGEGGGERIEDRSRSEGGSSRGCFSERKTIGKPISRSAPERGLIEPMSIGAKKSSLKLGPGGGPALLDLHPQRPVVGGSDKKV